MTAPTIDRSAPASSNAMPNVDAILDAVHPIYAASKDGWAREERRYEGGDGVLEELEQFKGEDATRYAKRKAQASYLNFGRIHAQTLAGHIARVAPMPDMGTLGEIRSREKIDTPSVAELLFFNTDGVGADGMQWAAWWTAELEMACATGHRWIGVELPRSETAGVVTLADVQNGQRPYLVGRSPLAVPYWELTNGRLDWAVVRVMVGASGVRDGKWEPAPTTPGYYLLVRSGYQGLGPFFARGGWFLYDHEKKPVSQGDWSRTKGQIPMFMLVASPSKGTTARPAISRSLTMELGQIAIGLMHRISERDYDYADGCKSVKWVLGADNTKGASGVGPFDLAMQFLDDGADIIPVVPSVLGDGTVLVPTIYDSSSGVVEAGAGQIIIDGKIAEAKEIMIRQITSTPDSSGASKAAGFSESASPLLAGISQRVESAMNSAIYFAELRAGAAAPIGFVTLPKEVEIVPLKSKIDEMFARMKAAGASSPTLVASALVAGAQDDGLVKDEDTDTVTAELTASLALANARAQADTILALVNASVGLGAAATFAGVPEEEVRLLLESPLDAAVTSPEPPPVPGTTIADRFPVNGQPPMMQVPPNAGVGA